MRLLTFIISATLPLTVFGQQANDQDFQSIVKELSADDYEVRTKAQDKLHELISKQPAESSKLLYGIYKNHPEPETRQRCYKALEKLYFDNFAPPKTGYLGVRHSPALLMVDGDMVNSVRILTVMEESAADNAGLQVGDNIIEAGGVSFTKVPNDKIADKFSATIKKLHAGDELEITLLRNGKKMQLKATLGAYEDRFGSSPQKERQAFNAWLKFIEPNKK